MSKFDQISAFVAVIDENGFAAAARKKNVSTAAISRQVARLESNLKVKLLHRTTRQISLTETGTEYYQLVKKTLDDLKGAEMAIAGSQAKATGMLSVTSNQYFATQFLLPHLSEFMMMNPELQINLELVERFPDLTQENIDLIFGVSIAGSADLIQKRVASTRYVLCASPAYLHKYGHPETPEHLIDHRYITHSMRKPDNVLLFKSKKIVVKPILWLNDSRAMCDCAALGMGIVKLHDYIVSDYLRDGRLIEIFPEFHQQQQPVYLYYQKTKYLQPKIRRFIDFFTS